MLHNTLRIEVLHAESDLSFLNQYQYEQSYYRQLTSDSSIRIAFTKHKIERRLVQSKEANTVFCIRDDNHVYLLFGVDYNELHSSVFNHRIIEVGPFYYLNHSKYEGVVEVLQAFFKKHESEVHTFYKCKIDNSDSMSIRLLQECGFSYVTSALKMMYNPEKSRNVFNAYYNTKVSSFHDDYEVQVIDYSDHKESIHSLIKQHRKSVHYYMYEKDFSQSMIESLFEQWFVHFAHKSNTTILGLFHKTTNSLKGFTSFNGPMLIGSTPIYSRDVTIIHRDYLGKGLALLLYKKMNEITNACIEGNPLSDNYRNVQFNQHCGYSIVQSRCYMTRFGESLI